MQVGGHGSNQVFATGYLVGAVKVSSSIFVDQLNAANSKSSKTQFQFQSDLSLAHLNPNLFC